MVIAQAAEPWAVREVVFGLSNLGIALGYAFICFVIVPSFRVRLIQTKVGGGVFFFTCALTHTELAIHSIVKGGLDYDSMLSWHMIAIHTTQVLAVWVFVWGLYQEFVKPVVQRKAREEGRDV